MIVSSLDSNEETDTNDDIADEEDFPDEMDTLYNICVGVA